MHPFIRGGMAVLIAITAGQVMADSGNQDGVTVGIMGVNAPRYSGADHQTWRLLPSLQGRCGAFFIDSGKGIGYDLQADNGLYVEHVLGYSVGRADKNSSWREGADKLKGMGNIDAALTTQLAVGWQLNDWLTPEIRATLPLTDAQGVQYTASVTLIPWQDASNTLALQQNALFGDARYNNIWYGVNGDQGRRSGYRVFQTDAGLYGAQTSLVWQHQLTQHWGSTVGVNYTWLAHDVADSPIVSSRNNVTGFAGINWTF